MTNNHETLGGTYSRVDHTVNTVLGYYRLVYKYNTSSLLHLRGSRGLIL